MCHKSKEQLKGTYALKYIEWGEEQDYHKRPTCATRPRWWELMEYTSSFLWWVNLGDRYAFFWNKSFFLADKMFYNLFYDEKQEIFALLMNSYLVRLNSEIEGQELTGSLTFLTLTIEMLKKLYVIDPRLFISSSESKLQQISMELFNRPILSLFIELGFKKCDQKNCKHPEHPYEYVKPEEVSFDRIMPDRRELDKIIFEVLGLTEEEQLEVYRAVLELVKNRLLKAKSR